MVVTLIIRVTIRQEIRWKDFILRLDGNSLGITVVPESVGEMMRSKGFEGMACSIAGVLDTLGDRWAVLILRDLGLGLSRYEDFRKSTGVTNATLSDRLKHLEQQGLIERRQYQTGPDRYEYVLTRKGRDIILVIQALLQVGDKWAITGEAGPPLKFVDRTTGHGVKLALVDEKTGERVRATDVRPRPGPGADDLVRWRVAKFESKSS